MTNPVLPSYFRPVVQGYSIGDPGGVIRTEVGGGMPRYGLDWDQGKQQFSVTLILDAQLFSLWTAFYHRVIKKGSIQFDMPLDSGTGMMTHAVNIMPDSYSAERTSGIMTVVSFSVEAENPIYTLDDEAIDSMFEIYDLYGPGTNQLFERLNRFATMDTLVLVLP